MFNSRPSHDQVERLIRLQEETNSLLREFLFALTGRMALTKRPLEAPPRTYTAADVSVVTREQVLQQERETRHTTQAPWRATTTTTGSAGPATGPTPLASGAKPASASAASSPTNNPA